MLSFFSFLFYVVTYFYYNMLCHPFLFLTLLLIFLWLILFLNVQKQRSRGVLRKRCSEKMQQIYRRTPMPKYDFNKVAVQIALRHGCSFVNLLHIFRTPFLTNTSGRLLLNVLIWYIFSCYIAIIFLGYWHLFHTEKFIPFALLNNLSTIYCKHSLAHY